MSIRLLTTDQAHELEHSRLFDLLLFKGIRSNHILSLPLLPLSNSVRHIAIPFNIERHDSISTMGGALENVISKFINVAMSSRKYIFSCDPRHFVAAEIGDFSYDVALGLAQNGGGDSDFIVFDDKRLTWMTYSTGRPIVIVTRRNICPESENICGIPDNYWPKFFSENIYNSVHGCSSDYIELLNRTYIPRLPGFSEIPSPS
ncbi:hypothetical protein [Paenirhodobacter sp.]|uniref:hypothetical protein n=1 Tax=Paenirhodobacter sp. TaxID=1965326 RepID=UPI003B403A73